MNISPHRAPERPRSTAKPGPHRPAPASGPPGPKTAGGRSLTLVSTATTVQPGQHEAAQPLARIPCADPAPGCQLAGIESLPQEVLGLIFDCLAVSTHSQCALVCHHWYNNLPTTRQTLALWLESLIAPQRLRFRQLATGYSSRTAPFLARQGHKLFPVLECQYQELLRLQQARAQPDLTPASKMRLRQQERTAQGFLSGLIAYSLQHHQLQPGHLTLKSASCYPPMTASVVAVENSFCGRWLAVRYRPDGGSVSLRLYGWSKDSWHAQTLIPAPTDGVRVVKFAIQMPDTLFAIEGQDVVVRRKAADSEHWYAEKLYAIPPSWQPYNLIVPIDDDLISLSSMRGTSRNPGFRMQISTCLPNQQRWKHLPPQHYAKVPKVITHQKGLGLVAQNFVYRHNRPAPAYTNAIVIHGKGISPAWPPVWDVQLYILKERRLPITRIRLSEDGQQLLGVTAMTLYLWQLDTQNKVLLKQLQLPCQHFPRLTTLTNVASFRMDGKQLVIPGSPYELQLWNRDENDHWSEGETLAIPPTLDVEYYNQECLIEFSLDGQLLTRSTKDSLLIWRLRTDGQWQPLMQRPNDSINGLFPRVFMQGYSRGIWTTAKNAQEAGTRLLFHTLDQYGQLSEQVQLVIHGRIVGTCPDGLTLLVAEENQLRFLQLTHPDDKQHPQPQQRPQ